MCWDQSDRYYGPLGKSGADRYLHVSIEVSMEVSMEVSRGICYWVSGV